jgi:uncharacterized protein YecE (DUF72 family)
LASHEGGDLTTNIHIGTMGWSYTFWVNNFYTSAAKPENFLEEYSRHFNSVEVNSSFYRVPSISTIEKWKKQTSDNFLFSLKVPKKITHEKLATKPDYLEYFLNNVSHLGSKTGPILFQFPPSFKSDQFESLEDLVSILPRKYRFALEVRNRSWLIDRFYSLLEDNKIALVLGDSPWIRGIKKITTGFIYIRWEGNRKQIKGNMGKVEKERNNEIKEWADIIRNFENLDIFGYFSKYYSGHPPTDVKQLLSYLKG